MARAAMGVDMTVLIRTSDVPPAQRYDAWRNAVCDTLGPLDMRSDPDVPLQGEIGGSSGAALSLAAAARNPRVSRVVAREPPYHVDDGAPFLPDDFAAQLGALVRAGRRGDAVEKYMVEAAGMPATAAAAMRRAPSWRDAETAAHTLAYEAAVMGPGNALPAQRLGSITQPVLVLNGDRSPAWMISAGRTVAAAIPGAGYRVLAGQAHDVSPAALVPELLGFFR